MTSIAASLVQAGDQVRFLTGAHFQEAVEAVGAQHVPLPATVDYDARDLNAAFPGRAGSVQQHRHQPAHRYAEGGGDRRRRPRRPTRAG
jgi:UDP:flavonoid glycosyltransferase YjiC (YdhE family)